MVDITKPGTKVPSKDSQALSAGARNQIREVSPALAIPGKVLTYIILAVFLVAAITPFYWTLTSSFRSLSMIFARPTLFPMQATLENYIELFNKGNFARWAFNSFFVSICYTILGLFFCSLGGFAFAKYRFPLRDQLFWVLLASFMIPYHVTIIPLFKVFSTIKWINKYYALIIPGSANAFGIFLMRQYIQGIPSDLIDAARIDGCSDFKIYYSIVLPVIRPALGALTIFLFLGSWNNFLSPLIFMRSNEMFTLPVGLATLFGQWKIEYGQIMAGAVISVIPVIIVFLSMQKQFIEGLTLGSIKG